MVYQKNILLCVSGGIAAYKACALTSKLTQKGANVKVIMTESASKFVSPLTFQALSRNPVYTDTFDEKDPEKIAHIDLADWADMVVIAPATANVIGKIVNGIADNMLTTTLLATQAPIYVAPAMNVHMYQHPAVMENMRKLVEWGYHFIEPGAGYLACGYVGKGRLEEPEMIIKVLEEHRNSNLLLTGKRILVSAGPTREKIDPVRFFTNRSTGKMGFAIAQVAAELGAEVTLVTGPTEQKVNSNRITRVDIETAEEMYHKMHAFFPQSDIVIKAAAVADYRPKTIYDQKMKKQPGEWNIEMERTKDILKSLGEQKKHQFLVGFAAETNQPLEYGLDKLEKKNLDAIVINNVAEEGAGFGTDTNKVTYVNKNQQREELSIASKKEIARKLLLLIDRDLRADNQ
jgi:phosphopantothenoylcysteine decarboxylase / phosphopantothenate---cysteine ligase